MVKVVFDKASGRNLGGHRHGTPSHDPATQVVLDLADFPDASARWDGDAGTRPPTAAERNADKQAAAAAEIDGRVAGDRAFKALIAVLADEVGKTPAQIVAALRAKMT